MGATRSGHAGVKPICMKALLVEDDPDLRLLIQNILVERGHDVHAFSDAESAWDVCQRGQFPLMILDWMLPAMSGLDLCRRVRTGMAGDDAVVIIITAHQEPNHLAKILQAGADDYVAKPFEVDFLEVRLEIAERHVETKAARRRAEDAARDGARLQGALLAANTVEHHLGNQLALTMGYAELLAEHPALPPPADHYAHMALEGVVKATETLRTLRSVIRLEEADMAGPSYIDLQRSAV
jgi:DNA-binding response OmpR family regulator